MEESEKGNRSGGRSSEGSESGHKEETTAGASSDAVVFFTMVGQQIRLHGGE